MDLSDIKKSVSEMSDEELQGLILDTRKERRTFNRPATAKPKAAKPKAEAGIAGINYNKVSVDKLERLAQMLRELKGGKSGE